MRIVGVDPGAVDTGVVVIDYTFLTAGPPVLVASTTVKRPARVADLITEVPRRYVADVNAAILAAVNDHGAEAIGVEGVKAPTGHARGRAGHIIAPGPLLATAQILGAVLGRLWSVPVYTIAPGRNGSQLPLNHYPEPLGTRGKGNDKRRHERSAYDVAMLAAPLYARERNGVKR